MKKILILGAASAIAEACARRWAESGNSFFLVARNAAKLTDIAADLKARNARSVRWQELDANHLDRHAPLIDEAIHQLGGLDIVLIAHGSLPDQAVCQQSPALTLQEFQTNAISVISLCTLLAQRLEQQGNGCLAVISSVAGDRGRASNYIYGAAKSAVTTFLSGLRQRLQPLGVHVLTIKPGFVDTPMTAAFKKGALWAAPERVATDIVRAIEQRMPVLYTPGFWRWIMAVVRAIPETLFSRLGKSPPG